MHISPSVVIWLRTVIVGLLIIAALWGIVLADAAALPNEQPPNTPAVHATH